MLTRHSHMLPSMRTRSKWEIDFVSWFRFVKTFSVLSALLLTSQRELSILSNCFFSFSIFKMYVNTQMMWNVGYENRVRWPSWQPSIKIFLFEWKWILIGLQGFIDRFWQNNFALKSRYGIQIGCSLFLSPQQNVQIFCLSIFLCQIIPLVSCAFKIRIFKTILSLGCKQWLALNGIKSCAHIKNAVGSSQTGNFWSNIKGKSSIFNCIGYYGLLPLITALVAIWKLTWKAVLCPYYSMYCCSSGME